MTSTDMNEAHVRLGDPVENVRIASLKSALRALTYGDMVGVATNVRVSLPALFGERHSVMDVANALHHYANPKSEVRA